MAVVLALALDVSAVIGLVSVLEWGLAGRRLRAADPERFDRLLALACGYEVVMDHPELADSGVVQAIVDLVTSEG